VEATFDYGWRQKGVLPVGATMQEKRGKGVTLKILHPERATSEGKKNNRGVEETPSREGRKLKMRNRNGISLLVQGKARGSKKSKGGLRKGWRNVLGA